MNQPLVSIIVPVFNAEKHLKESIDSVLFQDYVNWELLIINDGSTDRSQSIIDSYTDSRIRKFTQANKGVSAARNLGLKAMSGELFCFLDADDVLTPSSLSIRIKCFNREEIYFVDGIVEIFTADMRRKIETWSPKTCGYVFSSLIRLDGKCFFGPSWMVKRKPGVYYHFDETLTHGEDLLFYISIVCSGRYVYCDEVILRYRRTTYSAMSNIVGLANGYSLLKTRIDQLQTPVDFMDKAIFVYKSRKIVFLTFIRARRLKQAFKYLICGSL